MGERERDLQLTLTRTGLSVRALIHVVIMHRQAGTVVSTDCDAGFPLQIMITYIYHALINEPERSHDAY